MDAPLFKSRVNALVSPRWVNRVFFLFLVHFAINIVFRVILRFKSFVVWMCLHVYLGFKPYSVFLQSAERARMNNENCPEFQKKWFFFKRGSFRSLSLMVGRKKNYVRPSPFPADIDPSTQSLSTPTKPLDYHRLHWFSAPAHARARTHTHTNTLTHTHTHTQTHTQTLSRRVDVVPIFFFCLYSFCVRAQCLSVLLLFFTLCTGPGTHCHP